MSVARLLDRDPLGDRVAVLGAAGERAHVLGLDADEANVRAERAQRDRDPRREAAAADRDDDVPRSGSCSASSSPIVPWPAITRSSSKACTNVAPVESTNSCAAASDSSKPAPPSSTWAP